MDFLSYPFQRVMEYKDRVDYSFPIWILPSTLLQAWPKEAYGRLTAPIRPYDHIVGYYNILYIFNRTHTKKKNTNKCIPSFYYRFGGTF